MPRVTNFVASARKKKKKGHATGYVSFLAHNIASASSLLKQRENNCK